MKKSNFKQLVSLSLSASLFVGVFGTVVMAQTDSSKESTETETVIKDEEHFSPLAEYLNTAMDLFTEEFPDAELIEIDIELEKEGHYDIQLTGQDSQHEYELDYDTEKEKVIERETDRENDNERALPLDDLLSIDEINEIALTEAGFGEITEWTLDWDNDEDDDEGQALVCWDIKIEDKDSNREVALEIAALTGDILSIGHDD